MFLPTSDTTHEPVSSLRSHQLSTPALRLQVENTGCLLHDQTSDRYFLICDQSSGSQPPSHLTFSPYRCLSEIHIVKCQRGSSSSLPVPNACYRDLVRPLRRASPCNSEDEARGRACTCAGFSPQQTRINPFYPRPCQTTLEAGFAFEMYN